MPTYRLRHQRRYAFDPPRNLPALHLRARPEHPSITNWSASLTPATAPLTWRRDAAGLWRGRWRPMEGVSELKLDVRVTIEAPEPSADPPDRPSRPIYAAQVQAMLAPFLAPPERDPGLAPPLSEDGALASWLAKLHAAAEKQKDEQARLQALLGSLRLSGVAARVTAGYVIAASPETADETAPAEWRQWVEYFCPVAGWRPAGADAATPMVYLACTASIDAFEADVVEGAPDGATITEDQIAASVQVAAQGDKDEKIDARRLTDLEDVWRETEMALDLASVLVFGPGPDAPPDWRGRKGAALRRASARQLAQALHDPAENQGRLPFLRRRGEIEEHLLIWRRDEEPLWRDPGLLTTANSRRMIEAGDEGAAASARFADGVALRLNLGRGYVLPAFEDPAWLLFRQAQSPLDLPPDSSAFRTPEGQAELANALNTGLTAPAGYVLPLARQPGEAATGWASERWSFRRGRLYLTPGDAEISSRLPLASLSAAPDDPDADLSPLDEPLQTAEELAALFAVVRAESRNFGLDGRIRTALSVQPHDGALLVSLPTLDKFGNFAELITAIEETAREQEVTVSLTGAPPPMDIRWRHSSVANRADAVAVRTPPLDDFSRRPAMLEAIYAAAATAGLAPVRREDATGAALLLTSAHSRAGPFRGQPHFLASLAVILQRHPSLSYLFGDTAPGPMGVAPRLDEARSDALAELDWAVANASGPGGADRMLQVLPQHAVRAELSVGQGDGDRDLHEDRRPLALNAFSMARNSQDAFLQEMLAAGLVTLAAKTPEPPRPLRWGPALSDRWMLPEFLWTDLEEVVALLQAAGFALSADWHRRRFDRQFPVLGVIEADGGRMIVRKALERRGRAPSWRVQISLHEDKPGALAVVAGGQRAPLSPTATPGTQVAGVRLDSGSADAGGWFELTLVDLARSSALAGCRLHVSMLDAGGVPSPQKFEPLAPQPGRSDPPAAMVSPEHPLTLDLRSGVGGEIRARR